MTRFDLSPLFRSTVGFDRLNRLLDASLDVSEGPSYPPYNIEKLDESQYRITMAVAGFSEGDIDIVEADGTLQITAKSRDEENETQYLHRGIAARAFQRRFALAEYVNVVKAGLENGLLHIELERRLPEEKKPRNIPVQSGSAKRARLVGKKAA